MLILLLSTLSLLFPSATAANDSSTSANSKAKTKWEPAHTLVFIIGVLKWRSGELESFSSKNRRDAQLLQALINAGVPKAQTKYLADSSATLPAIFSSLRSSLKNCPPQDTFVFYYCGHGWLDEKGKGFFANYDAGKTNADCLSVDQIVKEFNTYFKGSQAIFLADCCRSGVFVEALKSSKFKYAVLTAATSKQDSTGNWTFTQSIIDALQGHAFADENKDGQISFDELGKYCQEEMRVLEGQQATVACANNFDRSLIISDVKRKTESIPERVAVKYDSAWWMAKLLEKKNGKAKVHWLEIGWDAPADDEWVSLSNIRSLEQTQSPYQKILAPGSRVLVLWEGRYYEAAVSKVSKNRFYVHYKGYKKSKDEWVSSDRIMQF